MYHWKALDDNFPKMYGLAMLRATPEQRRSQTFQRCDASAVPRSVTVGPYGSAVWWLATLYSSSYGHHGLSPCSTDIGQGALQVLWSVGPVTAKEITGRGRGHVHRGDRCGHRLPTGGGQEQPSSPQHELLAYLASGKPQH